MILMFKGASDVAAAANGTGLTLTSFSGMTQVNSDIGVLAGYLVASIPFLAGGIAKGALAIAGQATSYLNPSQNAAEEAAARGQHRQCVTRQQQYRQFERVLAAVCTRLDST